MTINKLNSTNTGADSELDISTIGKLMDYRIQQARQNLETLCVMKAKAEALQMLDYPTEFIQKLSW